MPPRPSLPPFFWAAFAALLLPRSPVVESLQEPAESVASVDAYFRPDEARGSFEMVMKPYPIPIRTTTYVSFVFNLPEDTPDLFHMVLGEVVESKNPEHLHHFVLTGCTEKIDADVEGVALDDDLERDWQSKCITPMGGWAPGSTLFGDGDIDTGVIFGRGLGIEGVMMNVHYTDGRYADETTETQKMAEDGIRVHYTPDFRPYTSRARSLIGVGSGSNAMVIPPGEPRFYVTRTCKVGTACKDTEPERLRQILSFLGQGQQTQAAGVDITCETIKPACALPDNRGMWIRRFCPASCGFCGATLEDGETPNPLNPEGYRMTSINYHAHLLGREMYATLLRDEEVETDAALPAVRNGAPMTTTTTTVAEDLASQDFWIYDWQTSHSLDGRGATASDAERGTYVKPGDRIQLTCVYDSTGREDATGFDISTYDEMCITSVSTTFPTPPSFSAGEGLNFGGNMIDPNAMLALLQFTCDEDETTDMHVGTLAEDEDARDIWKMHPLEDAEGCTFPHNMLGLSQFGSRCPPGVGFHLCPDGGMDGDVVAGHACTGGTMDGKDSNDGTKEVECVEGGGAYTPYTCEEAEYFLANDAEAAGLTEPIVQFVAQSWFRPKCCKDDDEDDEKTGLPSFIIGAAQETDKDADQDVDQDAEADQDVDQDVDQDMDQDMGQDVEQDAGADSDANEGAEEGSDSDQEPGTVKEPEGDESSAPTFGSALLTLLYAAAAVPALLL